MAWVGVQVDPSEARACPERSRPMQNVVVGHETEWSRDCPGEDWWDQTVPRRVAMLPVADTTTQEEAEAQEMSWTGLVAVPSSTWMSWPHVGPSKVATTPAVLTEAQNVGDVHDTRYWPPAGLDGAGP